VKGTGASILSDCLLRGANDTLTADENDFPNAFSCKLSMILRNMDLPKKQRKRYRRKGVRKSGPPQRKIGRPLGTFKDIDTAKLISDIARGIPIKIACAAVGIADHTFQNWLDQRPELVQALATEKQNVIMEALNAIKSCSTKEREFRHLTWFLETVYRDFFAPPDKGFNFTQNNLMLGDLDEARRILDAAKALPYRSEQKV
jgi:hypothetical protein